MKLEELVLTIEQAKHLQSLGLDMSDAALCWYKIPFKDSKWCITDITGKMRDDIGRCSYITPTYTLQEVLDKLPKEIHVDACCFELVAQKRTSYVGYDDTIHELNLTYFLGSNLIETAYNMLCWLIKNGYLKEDKK